MKNFLYHLHIFFSQVAKFFSSEKHLHNAKFASPHELKSILSDKLDGTNLLLGKSHFNRVLRISAETRKELGNLLVVAPTRGGKGLLGTSQLLTWQGSAVVNDIKGELFNETAGYRSTLGKVFVIDPTGIGHRYDPLLGKYKDFHLQSAATNLLYKDNENEGIIFTQRATVMLTQLFLAARMENQNLLGYVNKMVRLGLIGAAQKLYAINPELAIQFLDVELKHANLDDKFLLSA